MPKRRGLPDNLKMRHDSHYVEELFSEKASQYDFKELSLNMIEVNSEQPRTEMGDLEGLTASIRANGVLEPILVRRVGEKYQIISGERRFRASKNIPLDKIPAIILDSDDLNSMEIAIVENVQRKDLTPFEEADGYAVLLERFNVTHENIALRIGKSRNNITETVTISKIPGRLRVICLENGITSKSVLVEIAREGDPHRMEELIEAIIAEGLSRGQIRDYRRKAEAVKTPEEKVKPYVFKYKPKGKPFALNLRFKTGMEPSREEIIDVLEKIISDLREKKPNSLQ